MNAVREEAERWQQVRDLVFEALELPTGERAGFLDRACAPDSQIREEVEALLERRDRLGAFLAAPIFSLRETEDRDLGRQVGPYQLEERIGSGGMGAVYLAQRVDGELSQRVAVKLLKKGLDTEEILRRFRSERQILADLVHPNVARLLDAGTTAGGRPYLVMEYVEGAPIDAYCNEQRLTTRQRVSLFRQVCAAVHFAHQHLVVHRDLKPANILVTREGTPKLLDFGVAKLLSPSSPSLTLTAASGAVPMTVPYSSPEQLTGGAITTATDVYSLGLLLYEILTGHRPYRLGSANPTEVTRILRGPFPRPSTRVLRSGEQEEAGGPSKELSPEEISKVRDGSIGRLRRRLRGDLDNIVLKALHLEPDRRFSSVEQLSEDLRRHLEGLPVRARPDSFPYRVGRFVHRHAVGVSFALTLLALILAFAILMTVQRQTIAQQREEVAQERDNAEAVTDFFIERFLRSSEPSLVQGEELTVDEAMDRAVEDFKTDEATEPHLRAAVLDAIGRVYRSRARYQEARLSLEDALRLRHQAYGAEHVLVAETLHNLALLERAEENWELAEELTREAVNIERQIFPSEHPGRTTGLKNLATLLLSRAKRSEQSELLEEAESLALQVLEMREKLLGPEHEDVAKALHSLARISQARGNLEAAERGFRRCLEIRRKLEDPLSAPIANTLKSLATLLAERGDLEAAEPLYEEALQIRETIYPMDHPNRVTILADFGNLQRLLGQPERAIDLLEEAQAMELRLPSGKQARRIQKIEEYLALARRALSEKVSSRAAESQQEPSNPHEK